MLAARGGHAAVVQSLLDKGAMVNAKNVRGAVAVTQLFEASYTTKQAGPGMRLAICQSIVEAHRGRLWAEENSGQGLTFYFILPFEGAKAL